MNKKIMAALAAVMMIPAGMAAAGPDLDLSALSFDELAELRANITFEMIERPEWKRTEVPAGTWKIGKDIPAGDYQIAVIHDDLISEIKVWGAEPGDPFTGGGLLFNKIIIGGEPIGKITLTDGQTVVISDSVVFCPQMVPGF